jgi:hypothetical protein
MQSFLFKNSYRNFGEICIETISKVSRIDIFEKKKIRQFMCRKLTKFRQEKKHGTNWDSNKNTRKREKEKKKMGTIMRIK